MSISCCLSVDLFGGFFTACDTSQCYCSCCCSPFKPRYKRLVDNIFPPNYHDGLVKSNMEKLIFYTLSSPEKLDRIGAYLTEKISRDLARHRYGFVEIAIEAMDQLLVTCHSLNLFVQSFLKVVQLVLESQDPDLQILATRSFVKFANIEEDSPSYHRSYDFFVCKFSSLCHNNHTDLNQRKMLRRAGLSGVKGLICKAVSGDLQVDLWSENNMEKIVPSLLFNMQCKDFNDLHDSVDHHNNKRLSLASDSRSTDSHPSEASLNVIAEECLRELIGRTNFGHVQNILKPIIKHFDHHKLWEVNADKFAANSFKIIMYSIQTQQSYVVVQILMNHLDHITKDRSDDDTENKIKVRTGIVNVLNEIISISVPESIGPFILGMITSLIKHLHDSISNINIKYAEEEKLFQDSVINTLGEFTNNLPDYQKIEIMIFIICKAPPSTATSSTDVQLQNIILNGLFKVTTKYKPVSMMQTFPSSLLNQLLSRALAPDPKVRLTVQKIFHQLLDRHDNLSRLLKPVTSKPPEQLTIEKADRYDLNFIKKHGHEILVHIYNNIQLCSNTQINFDSIYTTMALICIEMNSEEVLIDLLRLTFAIQELATSKSCNISDSHRCYIHSLVAGFLHLFSHLKAIPAICTHVEQVIKTRRHQAKHLLPEYNDRIDKLVGEVLPDVKSKAADLSSRQNSVENLISDELLFNKNVISEALQTTGHDISALSSPFISNNEVDSSMTRSVSDLNAITLEIDSVNSSPGIARKLPEQEITFATFKEVLTNSQYNDKLEDSRRRLNLINNFKNSNFEQLVENYEKTNDSLFEKLLNTIDKSIENSRSLDKNLECSDSMDTTETGALTLLANPLESQDKVDIFQPCIVGQQQPNWHIYNNPLLSLSDFSKINPQGPPLFALRFPDLFVY